MLANPALALFIRVPSGPGPTGIRAICLAGRGKIQLPTYRTFFLALGSIVSRQNRFQSRFNRQHRPLKIPAKAAGPPFMKHIAGAIQGKAELLPLVIVGA